MPFDQLILMTLLGLLGGTIGGLLGLGGGVVVIPALTILLGPDQHFYQGTMMLVYIVTALPAAWKHNQAKAIRFDALRGLVPASIVTMLLGVFLGNQLPEAQLRLLFALFLVYVIVTDGRRLIVEFRKSRAEERAGNGKAWPAASADRVSVLAGGIIGLFTGFTSGLLGIGGGVVCVPLLQRVARLSLRESIATSIGLILITGTVGAIAKTSTIPSTTNGAHSVGDAVLLAAFLAPGAVVGGLLGATLTHKLPIPWVRAAFITLLSLSVLQMTGLVRLG